MEIIKKQKVLKMLTKSLSFEINSEEKMIEKTKVMVLWLKL